MIGQIIQSYLVSLGVQIDKPGFQQADATIKETGAVIERQTENWARDFVKASTIISSAIAGVTASVVGLMKATAKEDLEMQKYSRNMMMSEDAAWRMKKAVDALGESMNDISMTPELLGRFKQLTAEGSQMKVGGDFKETMKNMRDLMFEFTRLKQEASYALNWVGYYLMKYLQKPLADIKAKFKSFNDMVIKNMSVWTEKVAKAIFYVLEVGRHFLEFLHDVGKTLWRIWDSFPAGVKKAIVAITALQAILSAGPLGRAIMLISALLLLIDDYYGYMEGKNAELGKYWDKLNNYLDTAKQKYEELKATIEPYWDKLVGYAQQAKQWFDELKTSFDDWMNSSGTEMFQSLIKECKDWWQILNDLYDVIENSVKNAWKTFMEELEKNGTINDVRVLLERLWRIFVILYDAVKDVIKGIIELVDEITKTEEWHEFIAVVAELFDGIVELFDAIMELVEVALTALFGEFNKKDTVLAFRDVLRAVLKVFTGIIRGVSWVIRLLKDLFSLVAGNKTFKKFWEEVGKAIGESISLLGTFGNKLRDLWDEITGKESGKGRKGRRRTKGLGDTEKKWEPYIQKYSNEYDVDPNLARAVMMAESGGNPNAMSSAGAIGLMQLMPDTAASLGVDPYDPEQNIKGGIKYLSQQLKYFNGDERKAIAAYNAGPGAVDKYGGIPPYKETQAYVTRVLGYKQGYETDEFIGDDISPNIGIYPRNGKVRVWSSAEGYNAGWNSNVTNTRDMNPRTKEAINALSLALENGLTITGGAEQGYHDDSLPEGHAKGYKFDLSLSEIPPGSQAESVLRKIVEDVYGGRVVQEGDHWDCYIPSGSSKYNEVKEMLGMSTNATAEEVHEQASMGDNGEQIGYAGGASVEGVNSDLKQRFSDAIAAMRANGYDFYIQNATEGSIGFTSPADDVQNIMDVLRSYGLSVSHDEHGFYVSLDPDWNPPQKDKSIAESVGEKLIEAGKAVYGTMESVGNVIIDGMSGFVDQRTATALGGENAALQGTAPLGNMNVSELKEVLAVLKQYEKMLPTDYVKSLRDTIGELIQSAKSSSLFEAMHERKEADQFSNTAMVSDAPIVKELQSIASILENIRLEIKQKLQIELPEIKLPEMPKLELPKMHDSLAEMGLGDKLSQLAKMAQEMTTKFPEMPKLELPQLPEIKIPTPAVEIIQDMSAGYRNYDTHADTGNRSATFNINVGGVTVNGDGKTNADVGQEVAKNIMSEIQSRANFAMKNIYVNNLV